MAKKNKKTTTIVVRTAPKQKVKRPKHKSRGKRIGNGAVMMHPCTLKYLRAITDPWNPASYGACIPMDNMYPSQKSHAFMRGTLTLGSNGFGIIMFSPCLANDSPCIYQTKSGWTGTDTTSIDLSGVTFTGQYETFNLPTPYTESLLSDEGIAGVPGLVKGRIVGAGIRWFYDGKEVDRAGCSACYVSPVHDTVEGYTISDLMSRPTVNVHPNNADRKKHSASIFGVKPQELVYPTTINGAASSSDGLMNYYPYSTAKATSVVNDNGAPIAIIVVTGTAATKWRWEYCQHSEYIGRPCEYMATENSSDPQGASKMNELIAKQATDPREETTFQNVMRRLREVDDETKRSMVNVAKFMYRGYNEYRANISGGNSFRRMALHNSPYNSI